MRILISIIILGALVGGGTASAACRDVKACTKACDRGDGAACRGLGDALRHRDAGDDEAAAAAYQRGCDDGDQRACVELGVATGQGAGVTQSDDGAAKLYAGACKAGDVVGCHDLATLADEHTTRGGNATDPDAIGDLCVAGDKLACAEVEKLWDGSSFQALDATQASARLDAACKAGDARACELTGASGDVTKRYQAACAHKDAAACLHLSYQMAQEDGSQPRVAAVAAKSAKLAAPACAKGSAWACYVRWEALSMVIMVSHDDTGLTSAFAAACDLGFRLVCHPHAMN